MSLEGKPMSPSNFFPLTEEQEKELESKIVWVLGTPRSGSTWLCKELLKDKNNVIWDEPFIEEIFEIIKKTVKSKTRITNLFFDNKFKENCWLPIFRKLIISRTYFHSQNLEKNIIIKEPTGGGGADILMECVKNSKIIFLLRDGHDVVDSFMDAIKPGSWKGGRKVDQKDYQTSFKKKLDEYSQERNKKIKKYSKLWNSYISTVLEAYENHPPELRLLVKYEDLRRNTFPELKKIYEFVGIDISDKKLKGKIDKYAYENVPQSEKGAGKKIRTATPGNYTENFSVDEIELMNSILGDTLKKVGYQI